MRWCMRALLAQAAVERELDPDRLSFTQGLFELTEMISLALTLEPEEATEPRFHFDRVQLVTSRMQTSFHSYFPRRGLH